LPYKKDTIIKRKPGNSNLKECTKIVMKLSRLFFLSTTILLLSACDLSLAADVTPPPDQIQDPAVQVGLDAPSEPLYPLVPPDPSKGRAIYTDKCAPCHGADGFGDGPRSVGLPNPVAAIGTTAIAHESTPIQWYTIISQGNIERFMPPFQSLTERQRWDVVAYIYSLSAPPESVAEGAALFQVMCTNCHGEGGKGDGALVDTFSGPPPDFSDQEYMAGKSGTDFYKSIVGGILPDMPPFEDQLSENERWALSDYIRSLAFVQQASTAVGESMITEEGSESTQAASSTTIAAPSPVPEETLTSPENENIGTVNGVVINGSGGEVPVGMQVSLHGYDQIQQVISRTITIDKDGAFTFQDIEMPQGHVFVTSVDYAGTMYGSDVAFVNGEIDSLELPIKIYDTTTDDSALFVERLHYFFELVDEGTMRVVELHIISNPGDKTLIASSEGQPVVTFEIPPEANNLDLQDGALGERYVITTNGFGDTLPVLPGSGEYQIIFSYDLPYDSKLDFIRPSNMPVNAVVLLVPEDGIKIRGDNIEDEGIRDVDGVPFHMYNGSSLAADEELRLTISGRATGDSLVSGLESNTGLLIGVGALGLALIAAGVWLFQRNRAQIDKNEEGDESETSGKPSPDEDADTLMDAILALDDLYKEGQLPEEAYHQRRAELKERLKTILEHETTGVGE